MAILLVVTGHSYGTWEQDLLIEQTAANIITGATALFVFISGFFFDAIFIRDFNYRAFMQKKAQKVLLPYLILATGYLAFYFMLHGEVPFPFALSDNTTTQSLLALLLDVISGRTLIAYWYIPFVMLVFLASPMFLRYSRLGKHQAIGVLVLSFAASMVFHRSPFSLNPLHSFLYFTPFYLFGMFYSRYRQGIDIWLNGKASWISAAAITTAAAMSALGQFGNIEKWNPFAWNGLDLMVPQKILLILASLSAFMKLQSYNLKLANHIANASFAIFFLHPWVLVALDFFGLDKALTGFWGFIVRATLLTTLSLAAAEVIKRVAGRHSRFLIGY